jgi:hypothetical protein
MAPWLRRYARGMSHLFDEVPDEHMDDAAAIDLSAQCGTAINGGE